MFYHEALYITLHVNGKSVSKNRTYSTVEWFPGWLQTWFHRNNRWGQITPVRNPCLKSTTMDINSEVCRYFIVLTSLAKFNWDCIKSCRNCWLYWAYCRNCSHLHTPIMTILNKVGKKRKLRPVDYTHDEFWRDRSCFEHNLVYNVKYFSTF